MQITLNGSSLEANHASDNNLEEILVNISRTSIPDNQLVNMVKLNGNVFSEMYPGQARQIEKNRISELEISTITIDQYATAAVVDCKTIIITIIESVKKNADLFRMYNETEAFENFANLIDSLRNLLQFFGNLQSVMQWDLRAITVDGKPANDMLQVLLQTVQEIASVQEEGDLILLADLLEYELIPALQSIHDFLQNNVKGN